MGTTDQPDIRVGLTDTLPTGSNELAGGGFIRTDVEVIKLRQEVASLRGVIEKQQQALEIFLQTARMQNDTARMRAEDQVRQRQALIGIHSVIGEALALA